MRCPITLSHPNDSLAEETMRESYWNLLFSFRMIFCPRSSARYRVLYGAFGRNSTRWSLDDRLVHEFLHLLTK